MDASISDSRLGAWREQALTYLRDQLYGDGPKDLADPVVFPLSPLEGEGATAVFEFHAAREGGETRRYFVVAGETVPNYYPAEDLTPEEAFELHLGTRFMLVLGVAQVPREQALTDSQYDMVRDAREIVDRVSRGATIERLELAAMFDAGGEKHAVLSCLVDGTPVYIMGRDAPIGFSMKTHLSPHFAYRLHIGHVLRREAKPE